MKFQIKDTEISYQEAGRGKAIVLVHAFPLSRALWAPTIRSLSSHYTTIALDLRGFGESGVSEKTSSLEDYADDLAALLRERKQSKVVLVGCSMGGYISFAFWKKYSSMVRALVLVDTKPMADSAEVQRTRLENAAKVEQGEGAAFLEGMLGRLLGATSLRERPGVVSSVRRMMSEASPKGIATALRAMAARPDATGFLGDITVPTLVIAGAEDTITPAKEGALWAAKIPNASFEEIASAGHLPSIENPEAFQRVLLQFLHKLP